MTTVRLAPLASYPHKFKNVPWINGLAYFADKVEKVNIYKIDIWTKRHSAIRLYSYAPIDAYFDMSINVGLQ